MKDLHHTTSPLEGTEDKSAHKTFEDSAPHKWRVDEETIDKNLKVDTQLLSDFYRLVDASKGVLRGARGANYRLSHPLGSNDVPTDAYRSGKSPKEAEKT